MLCVCVCVCVCDTVCVSPDLDGYRAQTSTNERGSPRYFCRTLFIPVSGLRHHFRHFTSLWMLPPAKLYKLHINQPTNQPINQPTNQPTISPICFTICMCISPDFDGNRAPIMQHGPHRTHNDPQQVPKPKYEATRVRSFVALHNLSINL